MSELPLPHGMGPMSVFSPPNQLDPIKNKEELDLQKLFQHHVTIIDKINEKPMTLKRIVLLKKELKNIDNQLTRENYLVQVDKVQGPEFNNLLTSIQLLTQEKIKVQEYIQSLINNLPTLSDEHLETVNNIERDLREGLTKDFDNKSYYQNLFENLITPKIQLVKEKLIIKEEEERQEELELSLEPEKLPQDLSKKLNKREKIIQILRNGLPSYNIPILTEFFHDREVMIEYIKKNPEMFPRLKLKFKRDKNFALEVLKEGKDKGRRYPSEIYKYLPNDLKQDKEIAFMTISISGDKLALLPKKFKDNKDFVLAAVSNDGSALKFANKKFQDDEECVLAAIRNDGSAIEFASKRLKNDKKFIFEALKTFADPNLISELNQDKAAMLELAKYKGEFVLKNCVDTFPNDLDIALEATKKDGYLINILREDIRKLVLDTLVPVSNREDILKKLQTKTFTLPLILVIEAFNEDKEMMIEVLKNGPGMFSYLNPQFLGDEEVALTAIKLREHCWENISVELMSNRKFQLKALKANLRLIYYMPYYITDDKKIMLYIAKRDGLLALQNASQRLRDDRDVILQAIKQNPENIFQSGPRIWRDPEFILQAILQGKEIQEVLKEKIFPIPLNIDLSTKLYDIDKDGKVTIQVPFNQGNVISKGLDKTLLKRFEVKYHGLCELICNQILMEGYLNQNLAEDFFVKNINIESLNKELITKSHILEFYSLFRLIYAVAWDVYPNNIFSRAEQMKLVEKTQLKLNDNLLSMIEEVREDIDEDLFERIKTNAEGEIHSVNEEILFNGLSKVKEGTVLKLEVFRKKGLSFIGHSLLVKKVNDDEYWFFDPNVGLTKGLTKNDLAKQINGQLAQWEGNGIFLLPADDYLKELKKSSGLKKHFKT